MTPGCLGRCYLKDWLGDAADEAMLELCCKPPPRFAEEILAITKEEQEKGYCSQFLTKAELDEQFGRGAWRAFSRFLLVQMTTLHETIHTVHLDFIASVASMVDRALPDRPDWLQCRVGTDDLPEAYRGLPVSENHLSYSIVCIFVPGQGWRFSIMYGLAYGLESAVISFRALPVAVLMPWQRPILMMSWRWSSWAHRMSVREAYSVCSPVWVLSPKLLNPLCPQLIATI